MLVQLRNGNCEMPRVLTCTEGNTEASVTGEDVEVRRSQQARGMQEEMRRRTREAPEAPVGKEVPQVGAATLYMPGGVSYQAYYSAVGKAHHTGKDLTKYAACKGNSYRTKSGWEQYAPTSLQGIATKAEVRTAHRFQDLYRCLNARFLTDCWKDLNKDAASGIDSSDGGGLRGES